MIKWRTKTRGKNRTCDVGVHFGPEWAGTKIPLFEEAVELAASFKGLIVMDLVDNQFLCFLTTTKHFLIYSHFFFFQKQDDQSQGLLGEYIEPILTKWGMSSLATASCWTSAQVENANTYLKYLSINFNNHFSLTNLNYLL